MRFSNVAVLAFAFALVGCAARTTPPSSNSSQWLLLASPVTEDFPNGTVGSPIAQWPKVTQYASMSQCGAALGPAQNQFQRPVACIASDDPRLREN
jgi:hypothetical protein